MAVRPNKRALATMPTDQHSNFLELVYLVDASHPQKAHVTALREALATYPEVWRVAGDLAELSIGHTLDVLDAPRSMKESITEGVRAMRLELGGANPPMLERMLIDQVLICWLRQAEAEYKYTEMKKDDGGKIAMYWERRLTQTQKRYLRAMEALARVRRLARATPLQVNIGAQQVNVAGSVAIPVGAVDDR